MILNFYPARWVGLLALLFSPLVAAEKASGQFANWRRMDSPSFTMYTDSNEDTGRSLLVELEIFRREFLRFTGLKPEVPQRCTVIFFASDSGFTPYKPRYEGRAKDIAGYFHGTDIDAAIVLANGRSRTETLGTVYHEYVHSLYHEIGWEPPLWFNEGTAELFSTFQIKGNVAYFGRAPQPHVAVLRTYRALPLQQLFNVTHGSPAYNEGVRQGIFYAQSWAFVHFLACNPDPVWRQRGNQFLSLLYAGKEADDATFRAAFGIGFDDMAKQLDAYMYGGAYRISKNTVNTEAVQRSVSIGTAQAADVECELGIVASRIYDEPFRLRALVDRYPKSPRPHEARAMQAEKQGDEVQMVEELEAAIALGTQNPRTHWKLAQNLVSRWLVRDITTTKRLNAEICQRLRQLLNFTLASSPDAILVWDALARTEAFAELPDRGNLDRIEARMKTWTDEPQSYQTLMLTGMARLHLGDVEGATRLARLVDTAPVAAASTRRLNRNLLGTLLE